MHSFHLYFYCPNIVSELPTGDMENNEAFLEDMASKELRNLHPRAILIVKVSIKFDQPHNMYVIHFRISCLYSYKVNLKKVPLNGLGNIEVRVEARLSLALLEFFGGDLPIFVESVEGWVPLA